MLKKATLLFLLLACMATTVSAQSTKQKLRKAKDFFYHEKYSEALAVLSSSRQLSRKDKEGRFLIAVCHYQLNQLDLSLEVLNEIVAEKKTPYPECWLYIAKIYHSFHKFDEATKYYKLYLRTIRPKHKHRQMVREEIRRCANGIEIQFRQASAIVENLGPKVNSEGDEFAPIPSQNKADKLYFSSMRYGNIGGPRDKRNQQDEQYGNFLSDMFSCSIKDGQWTHTKRMHYLLNSPQHEKLIGFNKKGSVLYYFKGWKMDYGDIIIDTFKTVENRTLSSTPLNGPKALTNGDVSLTIYNDTLIIFSSRRGGGFGGKDLYITAYKDGGWSTPLNLGKTINTPYDETTPYLSPDGKTLYFSSNDSRKSIGGYDIFRSVFIRTTQKWSIPMNIGIPLNSASDDTGFRLSRDGFTAFFDSSRKDGFGKRDLYVAYFQTHLNEVEEPLYVYTPPTTTSEVITATVPVKYEEPPVIIQTPTAPTKVEPKEELPVFTETIEASPSIEVAEPPVTTTTANEQFSPLYFSEIDLPLDFRQKDLLNPVIAVLAKKPGIALVITAYSNENTSIPMRLFHAINLTEKVAKYIQSKGIPATAIYMRALDGSKGTVKTPFVLEFTFTGTSGTPVQGIVPVIGDYYTSSVAGFTTNKALCYKVQFSSALKASKKEILNTAPYPMIEKTIDFKYYRYTLGAFERFEDAFAYSQKLRTLGYKDAYVVPFLYGKRVDKNEVKKNIGVFPDLAKYLKG